MSEVLKAYHEADADLKAARAKMIKASDAMAEQVMRIYNACAKQKNGYSTRRWPTFACLWMFKDSASAHIDEIKREQEIAAKRKKAAEKDRAEHARLKKLFEGKE